jgi:curved DNA-binding protein CbpA
MNYYEELGVSCDCSTEELHRAYKTLARLMHPDGQVDEKLRAMAERQMTRLNEILATLTDAERRREYDQKLAAEERAVSDIVVFPRPMRPRFMRRPAMRADWKRVVLKQRYLLLLLGGLVILCVAVWHYIGDELVLTEGAARTLPEAVEAATPAAPARRGPQGDERGSGTRPAQARAPSTARVEEGAGAPGDAGAESEEAKRSNGAASVPSGAEKTAAAIQDPTEAPVPVSSNVQTESRAERTDAASREPSFSGNWFYAPEFGEKADVGSYSAQYIEFILVEDSGNIVGNYRAEYKVPDKAIHPEVVFHAQGKADGGKAARMSWSSKDGAKGEVELTLRSPNLMRVVWWTSEFGSRAALASGEAWLIRQRER